MKKLIVFIQIVLLFLLNNDLTAQSKMFESFQLGLRVAPNISWLKPNTQDYSSDGALLNFSWGFVCDYRFANNYYFSSGFNVNSCGGKLSYPYLDAITGNGIGNMNATYYLRYLEIPLTIKMKTHQFKNITYYGQIGIGANIIIGANADENFLPVNTNINVINNNVNVINQFNEFMFTLIVALGTEYSLGGRTYLFGELRFNNGLTNIMDFNNNISPYNAAHAIPNSVELAFGIMF